MATRFGTALVCAAILIIQPVSEANATSAPSVTTSVLYVGGGVGVISAELPSGCNTVYLTADFTTWRNVSPPNKVVAGSCLYVWTSASFVSPTNGWLLGRNMGSTVTVLERTTDGGKTWSRQPGDTTGSNAGAEAIAFVNAAVGWRQQFSWGANSYKLSRTLNGGTTWTTRAYYPRTGCPMLSDVFSSASVGFAGSPLAGSTMSVGSVNLPYVWRTINGGATWLKMVLARPSSVPIHATGLYGLPVFAGRIGTLPIDYPVGGHQDLFFYSSRDYGIHWSLITTVASPLVVLGAVTLNENAVAQGCYASDTVAKGSLASVSLVNPSTWWILRPSSTGNSERFVVQNGSVSTLKIKFLPDTAGRAVLQAASSTKAVVTLGKSVGPFHVFVTVDGGAEWYPLSPPSQTGNQFTEWFGGGGITKS